MICVEEYETLLKKLRNTDSRAYIAFRLAKTQKQIDDAVKLKKHAMKLLTMACTMAKELKGFEVKCVDHTGVEDELDEGVTYMAFEHKKTKLVWVINKSGIKLEYFRERFLEV